MNPSKQEKSIAPMAEFLATQLGYPRHDVVYTRNISDMLSKFESNEVDFFTGSFWEAAVLMSAGVGEPVAIKFKEENEGYRSMIVVRTDSDIHELSDLAGKLVAFEDPDSTSAYRIPYLSMQDAGLTLIENLDRPQDSQAVHYRFSNAEQISSAWLYRNIVDAICISDSDWEKADNVPDFQKEFYRVIYTSEELPRAVEVMRKNLPEEIKIRLHQILLDPNLIHSQQALLDDYHETSGFSEVDGKTLENLASLAQSFSK